MAPRNSLLHLGWACLAGILVWSALANGRVLPSEGQAPGAALTRVDPEEAGTHQRGLLAAGDIVGRWYCGTTEQPDPYMGNATWEPITATQLLVGSPASFTNAPISFADSFEFVYQSACVGPSMKVRLPVPKAGDYVVTAMFAEPYFQGAGARVFDVALEGVLLLDSMDIVYQAGAALRAYNTSFPATTTDAWLTLIFSAVRDQAMFSGLVITESVAAPPTNTTNQGIGIYCGSLNFTNNGRLWAPAATSPYVVAGLATGIPYGGTIDGSGTLARVFRTECFGNPSIRFPVPATGYYVITFYFSENYWTAAGKRVFSILIEGDVVYPNYDIYADVGANTAATKVFYVLATDTAILINFLSVVDQAHFSGIAIDAYTPAPGQPIPSPPPIPPPPPSTPPPTTPPASTPSPPPINITSGTFQMYCGTGTFIDAWGGAWTDNTATPLGPAGFGNTGTAIDGAPLQLMRVYQSECVAPVLTLTIPVPDAITYEVTILNSENWFTDVGARVFSVAAEGTTVFPSIDLVALAGGKFRAVNITFRVVVADGTLNIKLAATKDQARFGGIYVNPADTSVPGPPPIVAPPAPNSPPPTPSPPPASSPATATWCGAADYVDTDGVLWQSRAYFAGAGYTGGYAGSVANSTASLNRIYASECVGPDFTATFTGLASGTYTITIYSAETYFTSVGARVFSITIQGTTALAAVDLYRDFGPVAAANISYVIPNVGSTITFRFVASADQARIGGILVMPGATDGVPIITAAASPPPPPSVPSPGGILPPVGIPQDPSAPALSINYNGNGFIDSFGYPWVAAAPFNTPVCAGGATGTPIAGAPATLQPMLQTECFGDFKTIIPVQSSGTYTLRFWNSEIFFAAANLRKFDVIINGAKLIAAWDVFAESGGQWTMQYKEVTVPVTTPTITIEYRTIPGFDQPTVKGLQLLYVSSSTFTVQPTPPAYSFQLVDPTNPINNQKNVTFQVLVDSIITGLRVQKLQPDVFPDEPVFEFQAVAGATGTVDTAGNTLLSYDAPVSLRRGQFLTVLGTFLPRATSFYAARLEVLSGITVAGAVNFDGTGDLSANVPHVLHVVADGARFLVDVDNNGALPVSFAATSSHTHDPAHRIVAFRWTDVTGGASDVISTAINASAILGPGPYAWNLTIFDDAVPPSNKTDTIFFDVYPPDAVPGTYAKFFLGLTAADLAADLSAELPDAAARMPGFKLVAPLPSRVTGQPALVQMKGTRTFPQGCALSIGAPNSIPYAILIDGELLAADGSVAAGPHDVELRAFVNGTADLPVSLLACGVLLGQADVTYDELVEGPVLNSISPVTGIVLGGTRVTVQGIGWKMSDVEVAIDDVVVPNEDITQFNANSFTFLTPAVAGPSIATITVASKNKTSNGFTFRYLAADQPVPGFRQTPFQQPGNVPFNGISCGQWCHGRYFFAGTGGHLYEVAFNEDHTEMTNITTYTALVELQIMGKLVLGLACNPYESSERFKIWLTHSDMFDPAQDPTSDAFKGSSDYSGRVGYFQWPEMDTYTIVIDNLPSATVFHSVASLAFDNLGLLYVGVGAMTNTGAPAPRFANLAESPWSSGLIRADIMNPNFKGRIKYELRGDPDMPPEVLDLSLNDQRAGVWVKTVANSTRGMEMFAYGLRNPLGLTVHTNGKIYTCDNGPNADSGPALLSPFNYSTEYVGTGYDRIDIVEYNTYHGIGNENRALQGDIREGTYIAREPNDKYYRPSFSGVVDGVPVNYTEPIGLVLSSSNGMDEYRSNTFLGAMRGWLLISKLATFMYYVQLSPDGTSVLDIKKDSELNLPVVPSLKTITGPGGTIIGIDYDTGTLRVLTPVDTAATVAGLTYIYDIYPWRAPKNIDDNSTFPFVITGANFDKLDAPVSVFFGTTSAGAVFKTNNTITGNVPAFPTAPSALLDITVTTGSGNTYKLDKAFLYLDDYTVQLDDGPKW